MLQSFYNKLPLFAKILIPLLCTFLGTWTIAIVTGGYLFARYAEGELKNDIEEFSALLVLDFKQKKELQFLRAKNIANRPEVIEAVLARKRSALLKNLLPLQASLQLDWIRIVDRNGAVLIDLRQGEIARAELNDEKTNRAASMGMDLFDIVANRGDTPSLLVGITPIKSPQEILGGAIVGIAVDDLVIEELRKNTDRHLISLSDTRIVASTLPAARLASWQPPPPSSPISTVTIDSRNYMAKTISIEGVRNTSVQFVLLEPTASLESFKQRLWLGMGLFYLLGGSVVTLISANISHSLADRLKNITQATKKITKNDFTIQIPIKSQDELGVLARGLNIMVQHIHDRDRQINAQMQQLEQTLQTLRKTENQLLEQEREYSANLEVKIEQRTKQLEETNQKISEILEQFKHTQRQLIKAEKMSSLGQLVAGIAHEINNPINFIHGNLNHAKQYIQDLLKTVELYQQEYSQPTAKIEDWLDLIDFKFIQEDLPNLLQLMNIGCERICEIVLSLRHFYRLDEGEMKSIDIHAGIESTLIILQHRLRPNGKEKIKVIKEYGKNGEFPNVTCYASELNQVFMNILSNAIDILEEAAIAQPQITIQTERINHNHVVIRLADNGPGIYKSVQQKIFTPFFTTKEIGRGIGLGLSISYEIITERHGGRLTCQSELGKGTEFTIEIPIKH